MDDHGGSKVTGIKQIARLKELLQKWQSVTIGSKATEPQDGSSSSAPPAYDSDEETSHTPAPPPDVPEGYLAVYVGPELRRFIIPTSYLSHSLFKVLLEKVEEEFGFDHSGGLTIPCEIETFKFLLKCMEQHPKDHHHDNSNEEFH